jgi:murein L,D-transpeptidase YcbB/YkuD
MALRKRIIIWLGLVLVCLGLILWKLTRRPAEKPSASNDQAQVRQMLQEQIGKDSFPSLTAAAGESILASILLPLFYQQRDYRPAWTQDGLPSPQALSLAKAVQKADLEGLKPSDYHLSKIAQLSKSLTKRKKKDSAGQARLLSDLDLLCTDAFLTYAMHVAHGKVNPETLEASWTGVCVDEELVPALEGSLASNQIEETLGNLSPQHDFYARLKRTLALYRKWAKKPDWNPLSLGPPLKKGDQGNQVKSLRRRLLDSGDLKEKNTKRKNVFDDELEAALCAYQKRHGLDVTGILDQPTVAALNVPLEERTRQIELNLERWRWMPHDLGERFIYVNIANFGLEVFEGFRGIMAMKVVAGNEAWQTPDFASQMTHLVINPYWTIPAPVLLKETVSYILQDPNYLKYNKMLILRGWGAEEKEIDAATISWDKLTEKNLNFRIRQDPGFLNVLGRLKFVFPNKYEVFLHDTPYQEDFAKTTRAFSHGCIRAEKPVELAAYVLRGKPGWDVEKILAAIDSLCGQTVKLVEPINVYFLYCTAWQGEDGTIEFRPDIYEKDMKLAQALHQEPPRPLGSR